nr:hypothetical protein TetV2_00355 [Oceanusvirus sp.]
MNALSASVLCACMIALGGISVSGVIVTRGSGMFRKWRPVTESVRHLPLHAFHARLHELEPLTRDTAALHAAVAYPNGLIPVLVKATPASETVLSTLAGEAPPSCVISGNLCRVSDRVPKSEGYLSLYGRVEAEDGIEDEEGVASHRLRLAAEELDRKTKEAMTELGTAGIPLWFLDGESVASTPFGAESAGASRAVNSSLAFKVMRLFVFHTFSACGRR